MKLSSPQGKRLRRGEMNGGSVGVLIGQDTRETDGMFIRIILCHCSRVPILSYSHLAVAGKTGHVATFDWQTGTLHTELQLQETCRDITYVSGILLSLYVGYSNDST